MITTVLSWGSAILNIAKMMKPEDTSLAESKKVVDAVLDSSRLVSTNSVARSAQRSIIAPMVAIEQNLTHQEFMTDLMTIIQLRDILNVLTHLSFQGSVNGIKIADLVDQINPRRAGLEALMGLEAYTNGPGAEKPEANLQDVVTIQGKDYSQLSEFSPLALGKVVMADTMINGTKVQFPLVFRQVPVPLSIPDLKLVFSAAKPEDGFKARIIMMKTEEITPTEFLTGADIIKEKFRIKNEEMAGYYAEAQKRASKNRQASLRTGLMSVNTMANAFVIDSETARQIELEIGLRFSNSSARNKIFSRVSASTIVVVNERRGTFTFYTDGVDMPETYTRDEIKTKAASDNKSSSLQDLMKLLNGGM